jgi:hypothetical protein
MPCRTTGGGNRTNRPWRLVVGLSRAMVAALGTAVETGTVVREAAHGYRQDERTEANSEGE